ncbi:MAG TPA: hypothetical protein VFU29_23055, partial [Chitinophagaceae bacterium]|nr:hypothetical protein [Chitinophagaceae bacterium]
MFYTIKPISYIIHTFLNGLHNSAANYSHRLFQHESRARHPALLHVLSCSFAGIFFLRNHIIHPGPDFTQSEFRFWKFI